LAGGTQHHRPGFAATGPNQKWGVDISYVWTREGWICLAVVIDLFSRRVVGWSVGDRLHRRLAIAALQTALTMRRPPEGLIHHSDRGSQYCSVDYQATLRLDGVPISMSGKGNCYDNAMVETFCQALTKGLPDRNLATTCGRIRLAVTSCSTLPLMMASNWFATFTVLETWVKSLLITDEVAHLPVIG